MNVVVDASAAVEYLLRTELGQLAAPFLEEHGLFAPELLDGEVLAVLRRAVLAKLLKKTRAEETLSDLAAWPVERVSHRELLRDAWALRSHVSAYDALYVVTAQRHEAILVTADAKLSRAHGLGVLVQSLRV